MLEYPAVVRIRMLNGLSFPGRCARTLPCILLSRSFFLQSKTRAAISGWA